MLGIGKGRIAMGCLVGLSLALVLAPAAAMGQAAEMALAEHFSVTATNERTTLDRDTGELLSTADITLVNLGGRTLMSPLHAVVELATNGVSMPGALGGTNDPAYGTFYFDLAPFLTGGTFSNGSSATLGMSFLHAREVQLQYEIVPYGSLKTERPPVMTVSPGPYTVSEGGSLSIYVNAGDPESEEVTLLAMPGISNATFAATSGLAAAGTFMFNPDFDQAGVYGITFKACDPLGYKTQSNVFIVVSNVNQAPVLSAPTNATVNEGGFLAFTVDASDPDDDDLVITATPLPSNAVFASDTKSFSFAPDFDQAGVYNIFFSATDGSLSSSTQEVVVTVQDVAAAAPGDTNQFSITVDPVESPTFLERQRVTGTVNAPSNAPVREPTSMALITGLDPATGEQGETIDVMILGASNGVFGTHFMDGVSVADFGAQITVNDLTVLSTNKATANITIASDADAGSRSVRVSTSNEVAVSIVGFNVGEGSVIVTGRLVDVDTTNAIAGAIVSIEGTGFSTTTDPFGNFFFNGVPPGSYRLVVNPPDHEPFVFDFNAVAGDPVEFGSISTAATVFDPNAPASVSMLSIIGRGIADFEVTDLEKTKQAIRDALILVGGPEAGVMDEFGNQLNPEVSGAGLVSLLDSGVRIIADRTDRGESVPLVNTLYAFSHGFPWTNGPPPTLSEWMETLQASVNAAWSDPNNPNNYLPILIFNHGNRLSPEPPQLDPLMRLNPVQNYMFVMSMLSYSIDPAGTNLNASLSRPSEGLLYADEESLWTAWMDLLVPSGYAQGGGGSTNGPGDRKWTSYWRGFSEAKGNYFETQLTEGVQQFANLTMLMTMLAGTGDLTVNLMALPIVGALETQVLSTFASIAQAARVPQPPKLNSIEVVPGPNGVPRVKVHFRRSPSDQKDGRYLYTMYRFRAFNEGRNLVMANVFSSDVPDDDLTLIDLAPFNGSTFYAITTTRLTSPTDEVSANELNNTSPWWKLPISGNNNLISTFSAARQRLVSDYSDPLVIYVPAGGPIADVNEIEIDPTDNSVYYSDKPTNILEQKILKIEDLGAGAVSTFAFTGFATPGHEGLAIDSNGDLYSHNKASDSLFGGRLFRFPQPDGGPKHHVGSINYYSRQLFFANPVDGRSLAMGPGASPAFSPEDLYTVDMLAGQVKRAPVQATYDPFRRVGQPYADLPFTGVPIDMEVDDEENVYLVVADALPRQPFNDREKGPMHIPPGAPVKTDCPPEEPNPFIDPVYPFSGEFYLDHEDVRIKGRGLDFIWARKYRSKIGTDTAQGNNWDYSYNIFITENTNNGNIAVHDGNTRGDEYQRDGTNDLWTLSEFFRELTKNGDGTYDLEFEDGGRWVFNPLNGSPAEGRILESIDRHGNKLQFFHNGLGQLNQVRDTLGRDIFMAYDGNGRVQTITDFIGRTWTYEYYGPGDPDGNEGDLKAFITPAVTGTPTGNDFPSGKKTSYTYSTGHADARLNGNLLTITDGRRNDPTDPTFGQGPWLRNVYATTTDDTDIDFDRILRQVWGDPGDIVDMRYVAVNPTMANGAAIQRTILNDRNGNVKEYFWNAANQCTIMREYTGRANPDKATTATANRPVNKLRATDPAFFQTRYEWNDDSLKAKEIHPNGNVTEWVYESDLDPSAPARTRANIRQIIHSPGTHTPGGDQAQIIEEYEYDTSFGRGCCGFNFVTRHVDGRGNETLKSYNSFGDMTQVVHRITSIVEEYEYNSFGQMTKIRGPDNGSAHRRVDEFTYYTAGDGHQNGYMKNKIVDSGNLDLTVTYEYDTVGNIVRLVDQRGNDSLFTFNALDQVVRKQSREVADGSGLRYISDTYYDANDNIVRSDIQNVDGDGNVVAANPFISDLSEYDILDKVTVQQTEVEEGVFITVEHSYDGNRNRILTRSGEAVNGNQLRNTLHAEYDERDLLFREIEAKGDAAQRTIVSDYDANGNLVRQISGIESDPRIATFTYDGYDRRVEAVDTMGNSTTWEYDENHNPTAMRKAGELVDVVGSASNTPLTETVMAYDAMNRLTNTVLSLFNRDTGAPIGAGQVASSREYSDASQVTRVVDDKGAQVITLYDTAHRVSKVTDHLGNSVTHQYNANGNETLATRSEVSDQGGPPEIFVSMHAYDNLGRVTQSVDNVGNRSHVAYDSRGNPVRTIDPRGNVMEGEYDGLDRIVRKRRFLTDDGTGAGAPAGEIVEEVAYDDCSRVTSRSDDNSNTTFYAYDARSRNVLLTLPDGKTQQMGYDIHDNVTSRVDAVGTTVYSAYDLLSRITRRDIVPGPGVSADITFEQFVYDGVSQTVSIEDDDTVVTREFDSLNRLIREAINGRTSEYAYDGVGNPTECVYPGGLVVSNTYDALNRKKTVSDGGGVIATYDYIGPKRVLQRDYENNTRLTYTYDGVKRIAGKTHVLDPAGASTAFLDLTYTWDASFNKTSKSNVLSGDVHLMEYDSADRLVRSLKPGMMDIRYTLDGVGNRLAVTGGPSPGAYSLSSTLAEPADEQVNQYTTTPTDTRTYDANGNLQTQDSGAPTERVLTFDYRNQLVAYSNKSTGVSATYAYDPLGRRIRRTVMDPAPETTFYLYDGHQVIEEQDAATNTLATYVYGNDIDERLRMERGGQRHYYHEDSIFNVMALTDGAGSVAEQYMYVDYGGTTVRNGGGSVLPESAVGNPYQFQGREHDPESDLYYFRTRYLDPVAGRFISRDRIGAWGDAKNKGNAFAYVNNNPWTMRDPHGLTSVEMACGVAAGNAEGLWDMGAGLINMALDAPGAAWSLFTDPIGSGERAASGFWSAMTQVAAHPDGISAGYAHLLFPQIMRGANCLEYMSDYDAGKVYGNATSQFLPDLVGLGVMARASYLSRTGNAVTRLSRMSPGQRNLSSQLGLNRHVKVSDLSKSLRGKTMWSDEVADLIEGGHVKVQLMDDVQLDAVSRRIDKSGGGTNPFYNPNDRTIYLNVNSDDILRDFMHEGVHGVEDVFQALDMTDAYAREMRAFMEEMKFQRARGAPTDMTSVKEIDQHLRKQYKCQPKKGYANPYGR